MSVQMRFIAICWWFFAPCMMSCGPTAPVIPEGVGAVCAAAEDCADGLACILEVGPGVGADPLVGTCGVPCTSNEECNFDEPCHWCEVRTDPSFCMFDGCK